MKIVNTRSWFTLGVALLAGTLGLQQAGFAQTTFNYSDFSSGSLTIYPLKINGNAAAPVTGVEGGMVLRLTPAQTSQAGSAFSLAPIQLTSNASFSTSFAFQLTSGGGSFSDGNQPPEPPGADGIVFVLNITTNNVGATGQGVGYQGIASSVGVKFDTWQDGVKNGFPQDSDPNGNFVAIYTNGSTQTAGYVPYSSTNSTMTPQYYTPSTYMKNGDIWYAWIDYNGMTHQMDVRLSDGVNVRPTAPQLRQTVNLDSTNILGSSPQVFAGFTSGTGSQYNNQDILSWQFNASYSPIGVPILATQALNGTPSGLKVYWSLSLSNLQLQVNTDLSETNWVTVPQTPASDGTNEYILVSPTNPAAFYRLYHP